MPPSSSRRQPSQQRRSGPYTRPTSLFSNPGNRLELLRIQQTSSSTKDTYSQSLDQFTGHFGRYRTFVPLEETTTLVNTSEPSDGGSSPLNGDFDTSIENQNPRKHKTRTSENLSDLNVGIDELEPVSDKDVNATTQAHGDGGFEGIVNQVTNEKLSNDNRNVGSTEFETFTQRRRTSIRVDMQAFTSQSLSSISADLVITELHNENTSTNNNFDPRASEFQTSSQKIQTEKRANRQNRGNQNPSDLSVDMNNLEPISSKDIDATIERNLNGGLATILQDLENQESVNDSSPTPPASLASDNHGENLARQSRRNNTRSQNLSNLSIDFDDLEQIEAKEIETIIEEAETQNYTRLLAPLATPPQNSSIPLAEISERTIQQVFNAQNRDDRAQVSVRIQERFLRHAMDSNLRAYRPSDQNITQAERENIRRTPEPTITETWSDGHDSWIESEDVEKPLPENIMERRNRQFLPRQANYRFFQ